MFKVEGDHVVGFYEELGKFCEGCVRLLNDSSLSFWGGKGYVVIVGR